MPPRYPNGTKVRIIARRTEGQVIVREFSKYENQSGVVVNSKAVVGFILPSTAAVKRQATGTTTLYMYTIKLEEGITLEDLTEYILEEIR
jgi:hypothetical protein